MSELPIGFDAAAEDWDADFAGRPMSIDDWNRLNLGEQQRYAAHECRTKGAVYESKVSADRISFSVSLPPSLAMEGLCKVEAGLIERWLHKAVENEIAGIIRLRQLAGGKLPTALTKSKS